jgi:hypothetical protein
MNNLLWTVGMRSRWLLVALGMVGAVVVVSAAIISAGRYQLASSPSQRIVWRIDTVTGDLSMCEPGVDWLTGPVCTPWSSKPMLPDAK